MRDYIKVYPAILNYAKLALLSDHLYRRYFELALVAVRNGDNGRLPDTVDIAWFLRSTEEEVLQDIIALMNEGLVKLEDDMLSIPTEIG